MDYRRKRGRSIQSSTRGLGYSNSERCAAQSCGCYTGNYVKRTPFFTQKGTQKVNDIIRNPQVSLTFWFELKQREVILNGTALPLLPAEIEHYWNTNPQLAQLRFTAYAPTSMQPIATKHVIEDKKKAIEREYSNKQLPLSPLYCGFRIKPTQFIFYSLRFDELSDVVEYYGQDEQWHRRILSP